MELATRMYNRKYVKGLSKCIENDLTMTPSEKRQWLEGRDKGIALFDPKLGGSYEVFNVRPLADEIALYCTQDVSLMPKLWKLSPAWARKVEIATKNRIALLHTAGYNGRLWGHGNSVVRSLCYGAALIRVRCNPHTHE